MIGTYVAASSVPHKHSWSRNVVNILIFHAVLLYIHYVSNFKFPVTMALIFTTPDSLSCR